MLLTIITVFAWFVMLLGAYANLHACFRLYKSLGMPWKAFILVDTAIWAFIFIGAYCVPNTIIVLAVINILYNLWRWRTQKTS